MNNPEWLETFIEEEGFTPIAEDQYECASTRSKTFGIRPTKKLFDFLARDVPPAACQSPRATY
jgi:hypothetical protein